MKISEKELRSMWNRVKVPTLEERIETQNGEFKEFQRALLRRLLEIYDEINYLKKRIERLEGIESVEDIVKLEAIPKEEAKIRIKDYINQHQGCLTSDIIYDLGLDPDLVLNVLNELKEENKIKGESGE